MFLSFPRYWLLSSTFLLRFKMSAHQTNKDKPRSVKCHHFCFAFDSYNYCPTCRKSGKGDDPCVMFESPCEICASFTEEQLIKITHRKHYVKKQKKDTTSSKDDELDLLGVEDVDSFTASHADLDSAADNLFTSPPRPQPLPFESLSLKTPAKTVPPTPGTALQQKIESKLEKSLGNTLSIHLQQQMESFLASMLEAFQSLQDELTAKKQVEVDQTSTSASKPGPSSQTVNLDLAPPRPRPTSHEEMEVDYGPALPPRLGADHHYASDQHSGLSEEPSKKVSDRPKKHSHSHKRHDIKPRSAWDQYNDESDEPWISSSKSKKHADKSKRKVRSRYVSSSSEEDQSSLPRHRSSKPSGAQPSGALSDQDQPQHDPDPRYYREVALSDIPSQYAEEVDTSGAFFPSLTPGSPCLGPPLQSWGWTMRKAVRSSGQEVLPLCSLSAQLSKMPLISLSMISRPLIYLRVNTSNLLFPLQSGTRWDSPVMRRKCKS